jgi:shikimate kinase
VALAGMMGCGKSTVGARLAARLGGGFADTDEVIADRAGHDIPWLFAHHGEEAFRRLEADTVRQVVEGRSQVIALGGGSLGDDETARLVASRYRVVWLWASPSCLAARTGGGPSARPLLAGGDVEERLAHILSARTRTYARASDLVVDAERPVEEITDLVAFELGSP